MVMTTRLARKLGLDGNPLRRRTDKIAVCLAALLIVVFLIGAPALSAAAAGWTARVAGRGQQAAHTPHQVPAVLQQAPARAPIAVSGESLRAMAQWTAPGRQALGIEVAASAGVAHGHAVAMWKHPGGSPARPAPTRGAVLARQAAAAIGATAALGIVLLLLAWGGRWVLDRRRLAAWEAAWAASGPEWTRRFRSRGYRPARTGGQPCASHVTPPGRAQKQAGQYGPRAARRPGDGQGTSGQ